MTYFLIKKKKKKKGKEKKRKEKKRTFNVSFFADTNNARSFKLCMDITSVHCYSRFDDLDFVSGHRCVRNIIFKSACFEFLFSVV